MLVTKAERQVALYWPPGRGGTLVRLGQPVRAGRPPGALV